jgi:hypothetical protein
LVSVSLRVRVGFVFESRQNHCRKRKSPPASSPAGSFLISLADLHQAMAVRRHGITVMVVMAVMVAGLH